MSRVLADSTALKNLSKGANVAGSVNKVILVGNLGRDPEARTMGNGSPVVNLSVATTESWKDRQTGERRDRTEWHRVVIFNENLAKVAQNYLKKGSSVYVEGQLQTRKWTDQSGVEKYTTEIVLQQFRGELTMLGGRGDSGGMGAPGGGFGDSQSSYGGDSGGGQQQQQSQTSGMAGSADLDDEIPF